MLSLKIRRTIAFSFIIIFLIVAPILLLYVSGYRYNFKKNNLQMVGSISVKTRPTQTEVYLGDKLQTGSKSSGTLRLPNLFPGKYKVTIKADGYYDWDKNIEVFSNTNTFINQVVLFKKDTPQSLFAGQVDQALSTNDDKKIAYLTKNKLYLFNNSNAKTSPLEENIKINKLSAWSANNTQLLTSDQNDNYLVYDTENPDKKILLRSIVYKPIKYAKWSEQIDYLIYAKTENQIYQINTLTKESRTLYTWQKTIEDSYGQDFLYLNNELYYTHSSEQGNWLEKTSLAEAAKSAEPTKIMKLDGGINFSFKLNPNSTITLTDERQQKIYLLDNNFQNVILQVEGKDSTWSTDGKKMLFYNDFELWFYDSEKNNTQLVNRYGQIIKHAAFLPKTEYLVFATDDSLKIIELDGRDKRNIIDLTSGQNFNSLTTNQSGNRVIFSGMINSQAGLYSLQIQE